MFKLGTLKINCLKLNRAVGEFAPQPEEQKTAKKETMSETEGKAVSKLVTETTQEETAENEENKFSLLKAGCMATLAILFFWLSVVVVSGVLVSRIMSMPGYSLPLVTRADSKSCKYKIKRIKEINFPNNGIIKITKKEIDSILFYEYKAAGISDIIAELKENNISLAATLTPIKLSYFQAFLNRSGGSVRNSLKSVVKLLEGVKIRFRLVSRFWNDSDGDPDFELERLIVGEQDIPMSLISDIIKHFLPQYRMFLGLEGVGKIALKDDMILFFAEKQNNSTKE